MQSHDGGPSASVCAGVDEEWRQTCFEITTDTEASTDVENSFDRWTHLDLTRFPLRCSSDGLICTTSSHPSGLSMCGVGTVLSEERE